MSVISYSNNRMETGTVSLTAGTAHADFPLARVFDRNIGDLFKATAAETTEIRVDQESDIRSVDTAIIAAGHNLDGETVDIQYSDNGADWSDATTQFTGAAGNIIKTLTGGSKRYWRVKVTSPSAAVEIPELFFSSAYPWEADPVYPLNGIEETPNIETIIDRSGENYYKKRGEPKRIRQYGLKNMLTAQKDNLLILWSDWGGYKPFWLFDHDGELFFTEIVGKLNLGTDLKSIYRAEILFREVLTG